MENLLKRSAYKSALINIQGEYIDFLSKEINNNSTFLYTHGIKTPQEIVDKGIEYRKQIRLYKEKINEHTTPKAG